MQDKNLLNQLSVLSNLIRLSEIDKFSEKKSVVLVIGNTGAGKSTTIDELMPSKEGNPTLKRPRIGKDLDGSQTVVPELYGDGENPELLYCDTAGFEHTNPDEKAAVSLVMQSLVQRHSVKGMLVVIDSKAFFLDHGNSLIKLLKTLSLLFTANSQIENFCTFAITHLADTPPRNAAEPDRIHSMANLEMVLTKLSDRFSKELKRKKTNGSALPDESTRDLIAKIAIFNMLQNALRDNRIVLTNYDTPELQIQSRHLLRQQFAHLSDEANLNDAIDFERYDQDRRAFIQNVEREVAQLLTTIEYESNLLRQYECALEIDNREKNEQRATQLRTEIAEKQSELTRISSRAVALEPFWSRADEPTSFWDKKIFNPDRENSSFVYGRFENGEWISDIPGANDVLPPVAKVKLHVQKTKDHSFTLWAAGRTLECAAAGGPGSFAGLIITAFLLVAEPISYGVIKIGEQIHHDKGSKFTHMHLGDQYQNLGRLEWEQVVALPENPTPEQSVFSVDFERGDQWHWYTEVPTVKVFVRVCDMPGNRARAAHLNTYIPFLQTQLREVEENLEFLSSASGAKHHQGNVELQKQILKRAEETIRPYSKTIKDNMIFISLVTNIFSSLNIPCHQNIHSLIRHWTERKGIIASLQALDALKSTKKTKASETTAKEDDAVDYDLADNEWVYRCSRCHRLVKLLATPGQEEALVRDELVKDSAKKKTTKPAPKTSTKEEELLRFLASDYDTQVWYDDNNVNTLMRHYFNSSPDIHVLDALPLHRAQDITSALISNHLTAALAENADTQVFYAPIVINDNHWIGLYIDRTSGSPLVYWLDPFGGLSLERQEQIVTLLNDSNLFDIELTADHVSFLPDQLQYDSYNCGPWIVEILKYIRANGRLPQLGDIDIDARRGEHRDILNIPTLNLSTQRITPILPSAFRKSIQTMFGHGYKFTVEKQKEELTIAITEPLPNPGHGELENTEHEFTRLIVSDTEAPTVNNSATHRYSVRGSSMFIKQLDAELQSINAQKAPESTGGCTMS